MEIDGEIIEEASSTFVPTYDVEEEEEEIMEEVVIEVNETIEIP